MRVMRTHPTRGRTVPYAVTIQRAVTTQCALPTQCALTVPELHSVAEKTSLPVLQPTFASTAPYAGPRVEGSIDSTLHASSSCSTPRDVAASEGGRIQTHEMSHRALTDRA